MGLNMLRGTGEAWYVPTIADPDIGPKASELTAGIKLGAGFNSINGLARQKSPINVPVLRNRVELQIAGPEQFQSVSVTVVEDDGDGVDAESIERQAILDTMVEGADGWLVLARYTQDPAAGAVLFIIKISVDDQEPVWDLGAAAELTNINLTPSTPLYKRELAAAV